MSMTDISDPQVVGLLETLRTLSQQVKQIDAELGTEASGPIAARNKIASQYVTQYSASNPNMNAFVTKVIQNLREHFTSEAPEGSDELMVAVYTELTNQLGKTYGDTVKNFLQKKVDDQPKQDTPTITDTRKAELASERTKAVNLFKLQKEMLKYVSATPVELPSDIEEPVARRGALVRGAQFTKTYQYSINGKLQEVTVDDTKSNATLANLVLNKWAKDLNWKTKDLRDYIISQLGVTVGEDNTVALPDTWEVTLPAPHADKVLSASIATNASVDESEDDDEEEVTAEGQSDF